MASGPEDPGEVVDGARVLGLRERRAGRGRERGRRHQDHGQEGQDEGQGETTHIARIDCTVRRRGIGPDAEPTAQDRRLAAPHRRVGGLWWRGRQPVPIGRPEQPPDRDRDRDPDARADRDAHRQPTPIPSVAVTPADAAAALEAYIALCVGARSLVPSAPDRVGGHRRDDRRPGRLRPRCRPWGRRRDRQRPRPDVRHHLGR